MAGVNFLSFGVLAVTAWCAVALCARVAGGAWRRPLWLLAALAAAVLLLRPHGDTFTALDHSGYRLMAHAFSEGRGPNDVDRILLEIPEEPRKYCTLLPRTVERNTRDRSFLLKSEITCETEPFFMPTLPLGAAALQKLLPHGGLDLFVPLVGLAFAWAFLAAGFRAGGAGGLVLAAALFLGSPLPVMLLRGFYAEVCGGVLAALAALHALTKPRTEPLAPAAWTALGLAPAFHPVLAVVSLPLLALPLADPRESGRRLATGLALFAIGPALLVWITLNLCAPYGSISWSDLTFNFSGSPSHRIAYVFVLGFGAVGTAGLLWRGFAPAVFARALARLHPASRLWLLAAALPLAAALRVWHQADQVRQGLSDLWSAIGWPFAALLAACALVLILSSSASRARFVAGVALAVLPVFAYLKGEEQMAMWSQRRLAPFLFVLLVALLVPVARRMGEWRGRRFWVWLLAGLALVLGLANLIRWPAPYAVRQEAGALDRVRDLRERIGDRWVFFDYLPDSFPFAVDGRTRALGWSPRGKAEKLDLLVRWLGDRARTQEVWCVSSYTAPTLEANVRLEPLFTETVPLARVQSKQALPAIRRDTARELDFLRLVPAGAEPLEQRKILDGGPLALRGNWGPVRPVTLPDGARSSGQWTREESGLVGPVPQSGHIRFKLVASSGRPDRAQRLQIVPPRGQGQPVWLEIPAETVEREVRFPAPAGWTGERTGVYRFRAAEPYDPARDGLAGYPADLGVLLQRVEMEEVP